MAGFPPRFAYKPVIFSDRSALYGPLRLLRLEAQSLTGAFPPRFRMTRFPTGGYRGRSQALISSDLRELTPTTQQAVRLGNRARLRMRKTFNV